MLAAFGNKSLLLATLKVDGLIAGIVGFEPVAFHSAKYMSGWTVHGLAWSVIVGAGIWGAAAIAGRFEAGRLTPFRLVALVLPLSLLLWVAWVANVKY